MNQYVGNLPPMSGVFPVTRRPSRAMSGDAEEMVLMRWGMPLLPPTETGVLGMSDLNPLCRRADSDRTEPGFSIACQKAKIIAIHKIPGR
jgi:hypothetical protein